MITMTVVIKDGEENFVVVKKHRNLYKQKTTDFPCFGDTYWEFLRFFSEKTVKFLYENLCKTRISEPYDIDRTERTFRYCQV